MQYRFHPGDSPEKKYRVCISSLLFMGIVTALNIVMLFKGEDNYYLFSIYIPFAIVDYAMYLCGLYPAEYYGDITGIQFYDKSVLIGAVLLAIIVIAGFLACWLVAKKHNQIPLIVSLIFLGVDTIIMAFAEGLGAVIGIVFHAIVMFTLVGAMVLLGKINNPKQTSAVNEAPEETATQVINGYSAPLRVAAAEKNRVLAEANVSGMNIVYRRVKSINELVINGYVYDEYVAIVEGKHTLKANYNGHMVEALFNGVIHTKILVDSKEVVKKLRLF